jgi:hypothetical protein
VFSCASQPLDFDADAPGFLWGLLHGGVAPVAFVVGVLHWLEAFVGLSFLPSVRAYAFPNTGIPYDIGFYFGLSAVMISSIRSSAYAAGFGDGHAAGIALKAAGA